MAITCIIRTQLHEQLPSVLCAEAGLVSESPENKTNLRWGPEPHGFVNNTIHSKLFIELLPQLPCSTHKNETLVGISWGFMKKVSLAEVSTFHNGKTFSLTAIVFVEVMHYFRQELQFFNKNVLISPEFSSWCDFIMIPRRTGRQKAR